MVQEQHCLASCGATSAILARPRSSSLCADWGNPFYGLGIYIYIIYGRQHCRTWHRNVLILTTSALGRVRNAVSRQPSILKQMTYLQGAVLTFGWVTLRLLQPNLKWVNSRSCDTFWGHDHRTVDTAPWMNLFIPWISMAEIWPLIQKSTQVGDILVGNTGFRTFQAIRVS